MNSAEREGCRGLAARALDLIAHGGCQGLRGSEQELASILRDLAADDMCATAACRRFVDLMRKSPSSFTDVLKGVGDEAAAVLSSEAARLQAVAAARPLDANERELIQKSLLPLLGDLDDLVRALESALPAKPPGPDSVRPSDSAT